MTTLPPQRPTVSVPTGILLDGQAGQLLLIVGPRTIRDIMMKVIAGIAEQEAVNVLDGGCSPENGDSQFDAAHVGWLLRDTPEAFARINLVQAANCSQVLALLEQVPSMPVPFAVLDLLNTFYDHTVTCACGTGAGKIGERKRLLQGCLENINRLSRSAGGTVSISPPKLPSKEKTDLFKMVEAAGSTFARAGTILC